MSTKFALYDFNGSPREFYVVEEVEVPKPVLEDRVDLATTARFQEDVWSAVVGGFVRAA